MRLRAASVICITLLGLAPAAAQVSSPLAPPAAAASAASAPAYVDRVIDSSEPATVDELPAYNPRGRPRWWRVESRLGRETASFGGSLGTLGVALQGGFDTANHGAWSIDLQTRRANRDQVLTAPFEDTTDTVFTLRQRGFPLGGGWTMNNDLGAISLASTPVSRALSRVSLPVPRVQGVSGEWQHSGDGFLAQLSSGRPAVIDGLFTNDISLQPGRLTQVTAQWGRGTTEVAAQVARGQRMRLGPNTDVNAQALWLGGRGQLGTVQTVAQLVMSSTERLVPPASGSAQSAAQGVWVDAAWRDSVLLHGAGFYSLGDGLNWAGVPMAGDVSGAYWRGQWQNRRWSADGGVDWLRSGGATSGSSRSGVYLTGNVRHRWRRDLGWSLSTSLRRLESMAYNLAGEVQWTNPWGQTLGRLEIDGDRGGTDDPGQRGLRLTAQHDTTLGSGATWSNSATVGQVSRRSAASADRRVIALATSADAPLTSTVTLRGNANAERFAGELKSGVQAALDWQLAPGWSLETRVNIDRGRLQRVRSLDPLTPPPPPPASELSARSVFVVLRYSGSAGSPSLPLGGRADEGGGTIRGLIYLDANRNGRQDAGERGAAGATVSLDGRYTVTTDEQGRFEFPWVAPGARMLTVLNETLPLPWSAPDDGRTPVQVRLRGTHSVAIGVVAQSF